MSLRITFPTKVQINDLFHNQMSVFSPNLKCTSKIPQGIFTILPTRLRALYEKKKKIPLRGQYAMARAGL